jgi:hypothetical protein
MTNDYPIFVQWYKTLDWILATIENFPRKARFSVASRLVDQSLDTVELIIDAIYTKNRLPVLDKINLSLEKQRILFRIAHDRNYITLRQYEYISKELNEVGKMVGGWRKKSL